MTMDDSIELLFQDLYGTPSEKLAAIIQVASLCKDIEVLEHIVQHDQLMSAFARLLEEDSNVAMGFVIGKLLLAISKFEEYHEMLAKHRIGVIILRAVELELKRVEHRVETKSSVHCVFTNRQENFLFICLSILVNLAENVATLRKMVKKGLVPIVVGCLHMKAAKSLMTSLRLLKLSSIFEETAVEIANQGDNVFPQLARMLNTQSVNIRSDVISILFNLSFLDQCLDLISNQEVHKFLVDNLHKEELYPHAVCLVYHLSSKHENRQQFFDAGMFEYFIKWMKIAKKQEMTKALAGLLANMTLHPLCAEYFIRHCAADFVMSTLRVEPHFDFTMQVLLKVVRNLSAWSRSLQYKITQALEDQALTCLVGHVEDPARYIDVTQHRSLYWEQNFWSAHVSFLWDSTFQCKAEDIVVELVGILNNMTIDDLPAGNQWHNLMEKYNSNMMQFLKRILDPNDGSESSCCDDLKLEVIVWLSELSADKECSCWLVNILDCVNRIFTQSFKDYEMSIAILYFYEQLLLHEETRFQVIGGDGVIDAILRCLEEGCSLGTAAAKCLIFIEDLDRNHDGSMGEVGCYLREKRFLLAITDEVDS